MRSYNQSLSNALVTFLHIPYLLTDSDYAHVDVDEWTQHYLTLTKTIVATKESKLAAINETPEVVPDNDSRAWYTTCVTQALDRLQSTSVQLYNNVIDTPISRSDLLDAVNKRHHVDTITKLYRLKHFCEIAYDMVEALSKEGTLKRTHMTRDLDMSLFTPQSAMTSAKRKVLNRHNPFAAVSLESKAYVYKDTDNHLNTLSFTTGNTLAYETIRYNNDDYNAITTTPVFTIGTQSIGQQSPATEDYITVDTSLYTPRYINNDTHVYL